LDFSIIIPTYNRPRQLALCLSAVMQLDYPRDRFEVIVVADGSEADVPAGIELVRQNPRQGPGAARNLGACRARGRYLAFTDDDCVPEAGWLGGFAAKFDIDPEVLAGGAVRNLLDSNRYAAATHAMVDFLSVKSRSFFPSNNIAMRADLFRKIGGFDVNWHWAAAEDRDLCERWTKADLHLMYASGAVVGHAHELSLSRFWVQHFHYGRGACWYGRKHPRAAVISKRSLLQSDSVRPYFNLILLAQAATASGFLTQLLSSRAPSSSSPAKCPAK
jgi:GT2 family glycosyltransferase